MSADRLCTQLQLVPRPIERALYDRTLAAARAALGEGRFAVAWAEGRALSLEGAITYALQGADA